MSFFNQSIEDGNHHISLTQKIRTIPKVLRDEDNDEKILKSIHQQSPHEDHFHFNGSPTKMKNISNKTLSKLEVLKKLANSPIICYLCGNKFPLKIIQDHHEECINNLIEFNPNVLIPKPPERPLPEIPSDKMFGKNEKIDPLNGTGSILSGMSTGSSSIGSNGTTPISKLSLRLYNAEAREIYNKKRPKEVDLEGNFMTPNMRMYMNEVLEGSASTSGSEIYNETWANHSISSFRKNSPANKKHMLPNKIGYRIGSGYGVDVYPPRTMMRSPSPIYGHTSCYINRGLIISFGGYEQGTAGVQITNKLTMFQVDVADKPSRKRTNRFLNSGRWREIKALNNSKDMISPRAFHTAVYFSNRIYVFGGESANGEILDDFWNYDLNFKQWSKVPVSYIDPSEKDKFQSNTTTLPSSPLTYNGGHAYNDQKPTPTKSPHSIDDSPYSSPSDENVKPRPKRSKSVVSITSQLSSLPFDSSFRYISPNTYSSPINFDIEGQAPPCLKHHAAILSFKQKYSQKDIPAMTIGERKKIKALYKKTRDPFFIQNQPDAPNVDRNSVNLILYGGITKNGEISGDIWEFNFYTHHWKVYKTPSYRYGHSAAFYAEENKMIVFGGKDSEGNYLNDVCIFDCETGKFSKVEVNQLSKTSAPLAKDTIPEPRAFHSCLIDRNLLFILNGQNEKKSVLDDIWVLDLYEYQWTKLSCNRFFKSAIYSTFVRINEDQFIMMGGMSLQKKKNLQDIQLFHFPDPEDESNIDQELVSLGATTVGINNDFLEKQIHDILCEMLPENTMI